MEHIKNSALELIGKTPILRVRRYSEEKKLLGVDLLVKLEYLNPAGSVKDRIALAMIEDAEKKGNIKIRFDHYRTDIGKYWNWSCVCGSCQRVSCHFYPSRDNEFGTKNAS